MKNKILSYLLGGFIALFFGCIGNVYAANCSSNCIEHYQRGSDALTNCLNNCEAKEQEGKSCEELVGQYPGYICCNGALMSAEFGCEEEGCPGGCCGIKLNTNFPLIGNCIKTGSGTDSTQAFPVMIKGLTKLVMALILVACFITIIVAGIMWAGAGDDASQIKKAKSRITKVAIVILLLGFSGAILRLINPNFFG